MEKISKTELNKTLNNNHFVPVARQVNILTKNLQFTPKSKQTVLKNACRHAVLKTTANFQLKRQRVLLKSELHLLLYDEVNQLMSVQFLTCAVLKMR